MARVSEDERQAFFQDVDAACRKAVWCALATVDGSEPRVRLVHPTWEGETLWIATDPSSPKGRQLAANPNVDIQYQVAPPDFVHVLVRGRAEIVKLGRRIANVRVIAYQDDPERAVAAGIGNFRL